jgi:hypothetical protein
VPEVTSPPLGPLPGVQWGNMYSPYNYMYPVSVKLDSSGNPVLLATTMSSTAFKMGRVQVGATYR